MLDNQELAQVLAGKSPEELLLIIQATQKQIRSISRQEDQKSSEESKEALKPYEEALTKAEEGYAKVKAAFTKQIEMLKEKRKEALAEADKRRQAARNDLNRIRQEYGLKATRRSSVGPSMSWDIKIVLSQERSYAIVNISGSPDFVAEIDISDEGKVKSSDLQTKLFEKYQIQDETGGKARGLMTRIKLKYLSELSNQQVQQV